jgi:hypothetical protein
MIKGDLLFRRLHLYLGLALLPWFVIYGVSSLAFSHPAWFQAPPGEAKKDWVVRSERAYEIEIPPRPDWRAVGARIRRDVGMDGGYGVWRPPGQNRIEVIHQRFLSASRAVYLPAEKKLVIEDRRFRWGAFLTGMHARGGFEQEHLLNDLWGVIVDVVSIAMLAWIATGLYLWWKRRPTRTWGWIAIAGGCVSFAVFLVLL